MSYSSYKDTKMQIDRAYPNDIGFIVDKNSFNEDKIKELLKSSCNNISEFKAVETINIPRIEVEDEYCFSYNHIAAVSEESYKNFVNEDLNLKSGEVLYLHRSKKDVLSNIGLILPLSNDVIINNISLQEFKEVNDEDNYLYVLKESKKDKEGLIFNSITNKDYYRMDCIVISNEDYSKIKNNLNDNITYDICAKANAINNYSELEENLRNALGDKVSKSLTVKQEKFNKAIKEGSFELFIYSFLGFMFLIGSGAVLYFKTMTSIIEDKERSTQLIKIGMTKKEISSLLMKELGSIFLVPPVIAVFVVGYFLNTLYGHLSSGEYMSKNTLAVFIVYCLIQGIFYVFTSNKYKKLL